MVHFPRISDDIYGITHTLYIQITDTTSQEKVKKKAISINHSQQCYVRIQCSSMDGWMDGWTDGRMDGWTNEWNEWM